MIDDIMHIDIRWYYIYIDKLDDIILILNIINILSSKNILYSKKK